jgi:outer membrane protein
MRHLLCAALAAGLASPAFAQSPPTNVPTPEEMAKRDSVTVAGGVAITPDYEGSDDYRLIPALAVRGKVSGFSFSTKGLYLYVDAIPHRGADKLEFNLGPIAGLRLNKRTHINDDIVELLPRRKTAIELGGFAGVSLHGLTNPYDTLALHVDVVHDVGGAHRSTTVSPNVDFSTPLSTTTYASASLGAEFVSNRFADYYFSIRPADSLASGLPVFDADGGMKNWKASLLLNQSLSGSLIHGFSLFGTGSYSRLVGDFKRSPIVSERGSANQWLGAAGVAYTW